MMLRFVLLLAMAPFVAMGLAELAANGVLGSHGWVLALVIGAGSLGAIGGAFVAPPKQGHRSDTRPRDSAQRRRLSLRPPH